MSEAVVRGLLSFPEPSELCLGYTESGTAGTGSGAQNAGLIVGSIVTAIAAGLNRPEQIEEIGILNEGLGADRISDAACNVLKSLIIEYTREVARFKLSKGSPIRVLIEAKKLHNGDFWNGLELQDSTPPCLGLGLWSE